MLIPIIINAATGRMGKSLISTVIGDAEATLVAAMARSNHPLLGSDVGYLVGANPQNLALQDNFDQALVKTAVIIDFSLPDFSMEILEQAMATKTPMVIGTTGFSDAQYGQIQQASRSIPIVLSANYSIGVNSLIRIVKMASNLLGDAADIEIFEAHHKHKVDSPSGTALAIGEAIAAEKGKPLSKLAVYDRSGQRKAGDIGFSVMRAGEIVGTHEVLFALDGEVLTIKHEAQSRQCFAEGAITAAKWLFGRHQAGETGLFSMADLLNARISDL